MESMDGYLGKRCLEFLYRRRGHKTVNLKFNGTESLSIGRLKTEGALIDFLVFIWNNYYNLAVSKLFIK